MNDGYYDAEALIKAAEIRNAQRLKSRSDFLSKIFGDTAKKVIDKSKTT